jgi:hypothetical protein
VAPKLRGSAALGQHQVHTASLTLLIPLYMGSCCCSLSYDQRVIIQAMIRIPWPQAQQRKEDRVPTTEDQVLEGDPLPAPHPAGRGKHPAA